ncbi:MAG: hypothetical protein VW683_05315 [Betaproteobacteria bacterium]
MATVKDKTGLGVVVEAIQIPSEPEIVLNENGQPEKTGRELVFGIVTERIPAQEAVPAKGRKKAQEAVPEQVVIGEKYTESGFRRLYTPTDSVSARELRGGVTRGRE